MCWLPRGRHAGGARSRAHGVTRGRGPLCWRARGGARGRVTRRGWERAYIHAGHLALTWCWRLAPAGRFTPGGCWQTAFCRGRSVAHLPRGRAIRPANSRPPLGAERATDRSLTIACLPSILPVRPASSGHRTVPRRTGWGMMSLRRVPLRRVSLPRAGLGRAKLGRAALARVARGQPVRLPPMATAGNTASPSRPTRSASS